ncbi:MAG: hypothetical protein V4543_02820 [Bacteroidota bacterium]
MKKKFNPDEFFNRPEVQKKESSEFEKQLKSGDKPLKLEDIFKKPVNRGTREKAA